MGGRETGGGDAAGGRGRGEKRKERETAAGSGKSSGRNKETKCRSAVMLPQGGKIVLF